MSSSGRTGLAYLSTVSHYIQFTYRPGYLLHCIDQHCREPLVGATAFIIDALPHLLKNKAIAIVYGGKSVIKTHLRGGHGEGEFLGQGEGICSYISKCIGTSVHGRTDGWSVGFIE